VFEQIGLTAPGRLTKTAFESLTSSLREAGIELGPADGEPKPIGSAQAAKALSISSKVRLRRLASPSRIDAILSAIRVKNFKSFAEAELPLSELTVLIGANASGKSNALEALQLLSWLARGQRLSQLRFDVKDRKLGIRGRTTDLLRIGQSSHPLRLGCSLAPDENGRSLKLSIDLASDSDGLRIANEQLDCPEEKSSFPLYRVKEPATSWGREMSVEYNNYAKGSKKPLITCVDEMPVFTQLVSPARFGETHRKAQEVIPRATRRVSDALAKVLFLDPNPRRLREPTHFSEKLLGGDGTNLSSVLYHLTEEEYPSCKKEVLEFIQKLPEQHIQDIKYVKGATGDISVQLVESFGGKSQPTGAALLSDGTLRVLAIAAALLSVPEGALVVIEEIDNGVHPSRAEMLMQRIMETAAHRHLRVLLTTHNPALLDSVPTNALPHVVASYRDPDDGSSRLIRLLDLDAYPELIARGGLGHLVSRGILDRVLKQSTTDEERLRRNERWLDSFAGGARRQRGAFPHSGAKPR